MQRGANPADRAVNVAGPPDDLAGCTPTPAQGAYVRIARVGAGLISD